VLLFLSFLLEKIGLIFQLHYIGNVFDDTALQKQTLSNLMMIVQLVLLRKNKTPN